MTTELCQRCGEEGDDRRTLWMACFYEMNELGLPFKQESMFNKEQAQSNVPQGRTFYTLRVCKNCRGDWMCAIHEWFNTIPIIESCGSGIFVRRNGANVEITEEEFRKLNPGIEPTRVTE